MIENYMKSDIITASTRLFKQSFRHFIKPLEMFSSILRNSPVKYDSNKANEHVGMQESAVCTYFRLA